MIARRRLLATTLAGFTTRAVRHGDNAAGSPRPAGRCRTALSDYVGIALLGDLTSVQPTPAARDTLVQLLVGLCALTRTDPHGRVHYVNPISGAVRDVDAIAGHRDWAASECPGNAFYPTLPDLRREIAALLRPTPNP